MGRWGGRVSGENVISWETIMGKVSFDLHEKTAKVQKVLTRSID